MRGALTASLMFAVMLTACQGGGETYPLVLHGGRVMDPATGLDSIRDVAIRDGKVVASRFGKSLDYTSIDPGVYRVEVHKVFRLLPRGWIYSNPIYVR